MVKNNIRNKKTLTSLAVFSLPRHTKKAFTLIELTISMGILALIVGLTAGVLISVVKSYQKQKIVSEIERNGDFIIRSIEESLRGAQNISCMTFSGATVAPNGDGSTTCNLGASGAGRILHVSDPLRDKYFGNGSDSSSSTYTGACVNPGRNCYAFSLDAANQIQSDGTLLNDYSKMTNSSSVNGVNVSRFLVTINGGGAGGAPYNIAVTIDVKGPDGSAWANETRTFQSFLTLRGTY